MSAVAEGAVCEPNISAAGVRMRNRAGVIGVVVAVVAVALFIGFHVAWYWRAAAFLPVALAATGFLQAKRRTCVARAREGTFEHDDLSKTAAPPEDVARSRVVAAGIRRDALIIAVISAALSCATVLLG